MENEETKGEPEAELPQEDDPALVLLNNDMTKVRQIEETK